MEIFSEFLTIQISLVTCGRAITKQFALQIKHEKCLCIWFPLPLTPAFLRKVINLLAINIYILENGHLFSNCLIHMFFQVVSLLCLLLFLQLVCVHVLGLSCIGFKQFPALGRNVECCQPGTVQHHAGVIPLLPQTVLLWNRDCNIQLVLTKTEISHFLQ